MLGWDKIGRQWLKAGSVMSVRWNLIVKPTLDKGLVGRWGLFIENGRCQMPVLGRE